VKQKQHILTNPENLLAYREEYEQTVFVSEDWIMHRNVSDNKSVEVIKGLMASHSIDRDESKYLEKIHSDIGSWLDQIYKKNVNSKFKTERLIDPWLDLLIYHSYQTWNFVEKIGELQLTVIHSDNNSFARPCDTRDFLNSLFDGRFNDLAIEIGARLKRVESIVVTQHKFNSHTDNIKTKNHRRKSFKAIIKAKRKILNLVPYIFFWKKDIVCLYGVRNPGLLLFFGNILTSKKWIYLESIDDKNLCDESYILRSIVDDKNYSHDKSMSRDDFSAYIVEMIIRCIPESFLSFPSSSKNKIYFNNIAYFMTSTSQWVDDGFKKNISSQCSASKLIIYQHGGSYGMMRNPIHQEKYELKISSVYFSWGWQNDSEKNIIPFVMSLGNNKEKLKNKLEVRRIRIILTRIKPFSRGDLWDSSEWNKKYITNIIYISNLIMDRYKIKVCIKLHPSQLSIYDITAYLEKHIKNVEFDYSDVCDVSGDSLDIVTQNSTVLLQKMAIGRPFIYFNPFGFRSLNPSALKHFKILHDAKIFHSTINELLNHIFSILDDTVYNNWWCSKSTEAAISNFLSIYGNSGLSNIFKAFKVLDRKFN